MKKLLTWFGLSILTCVLAFFVLFFERDVPLETLKPLYTNENSAFMPLMGMQVHYRDEGVRTDTLPLILLHGMSSSLNTWDSVVYNLKGKRRLISVDLPGFGMTGPHPLNTYNFPMFTLFIDSLTTKLGIKRFVLAGNSMGGGIAWNYALVHPERVAKLILIDAAGYKSPKNQQKSLGFTLASIPVVNNLLLYFTPKILVRKSLESIYVNQAMVTDAQVERFHDIVVREGNRAAALTIFKSGFGEPAGKISAVKTPTLIVWGDQDAVIHVSNAYKFKRDIKGSELLIFPNTGHVPMEETPVKLAKAMLEF